MNWPLWLCVMDNISPYLSWWILVLPSLTPKTRSFRSVMNKHQLLQSLWQISPLSGKPAGLFALRYAAIKHYFQICNFLSPCQSTWASPPQTESLLWNMASVCFGHQPEDSLSEWIFPLRSRSCVYWCVHLLVLLLLSFSFKRSIPAYYRTHCEQLSDFNFLWKE